MLKNPSDLLSEVIEIAISAGKEILTFYGSTQLTISQKQDQTPLTTADRAAHQFIVYRLAQLNDWPILSEEGEIPDFKVRSEWSCYWIIDPLDGTRGFIQGLEEFTVNIAVIRNNEPILGVIYVPVFQQVFFATQGGGSFWFDLGVSKTHQPLGVAKQSFDQLRFIIGKYHQIKPFQLLLDLIPNATLLRMNSSMKFTEIAKGTADVYVRFGPISEWDTAAGQCILREAGGWVVDFNGQSLQYNVRESLLCPPFLAVAHRAHGDRLIRLLKQEEKNND